MYDIVVFLFQYDANIQFSYLMCQFLLPQIHVCRHSSQPWRNIFNELSQIIHAFDDFSDRQIVEDFSASSDDFSDFRLVETQQQGGRALQNASSSIDQLFSSRNRKWITL